MGLDIYLYRAEPLGDRNPQSIDDFKTLEDHPELKVFEHLSFDRENGYYDLEKAVALKGYKLENLTWSETICAKRITFIFKDKGGKKINVTDPPVVKRIEKCIAYSEVSYQRKGANSQFYEDEIWDGPYVVDIDVLKTHWEKYFSRKTPASKGGFGSGVEYDLSDEEMKHRFKENILDKFIQGQTFVVYA